VGLAPGQDQAAAWKCQPDAVQREVTKLRWCAATLGYPPSLPSCTRKKTKRKGVRYVKVNGEPKCLAAIVPATDICMYMYPVTIGSDIHHGRAHRS